MQTSFWLYLHEGTGSLLKQARGEQVGDAALMTTEEETVKSPVQNMEMSRRQPRWSCVQACDGKSTQTMVSEEDMGESEDIPQLILCQTPPHHFIK